MLNCCAQILIVFNESLNTLQKVIGDAIRTWIVNDQQIKIIKG